MLCLTLTSGVSSDFQVTTIEKVPKKFCRSKFSSITIQSPLLVTLWSNSIGTRAQPLGVELHLTLCKREISGAFIPEGASLNRPPTFEGKYYYY